ncbi:DMT family transporter [Cyanobium gracile UHCC 0139]|uniref:DMT family transporter n=1 Tax=Cyanobium gracile UHCC 0139 TaxID=3110308 RepID=A0ABU5RRF1_9CYAN|nr:DMT family transporter [Cyanobium gracile]MEA5390334.1 DMT family transporter [Cyanobium gracile UHCC 0139]
MPMLPLIDSRWIGILAALGSAASWALGSILFKGLGAGVSSLAMTLGKGVLSVLLLSMAVLVTGTEPIAAKPALLLMLSGVVGIGLGDTFFFEALKALSAHAMVILLMLGQVLTAGLAILLLGEVPSTDQWIAMGLVVLGVGVVLSSQQAGEAGSSRTRGVIFGLLAVFCMSLSLIIAKQGLDQVSALQATWIRMLSGSLCLVLLGLISQRLDTWIGPFRHRPYLARFLGSVMVVTFGGFWLSLVALKHLDVAVANTLTSTEPIFILPLAFYFLRERVSRLSLLGTGVSMTGIVLLCAL